MPAPPPPSCLPAQLAASLGPTSPTLASPSCSPWWPAGWSGALASPCPSTHVVWVWRGHGPGRPRAGRAIAAALPSLFCNPLPHPPPQTLHAVSSSPWPRAAASLKSRRTSMGKGPARRDRPGARGRRHAGAVRVQRASRSTLLCSSCSSQAPAPAGPRPACPSPPQQAVPPPGKHFGLPPPSTYLNSVHIKGLLTVRTLITKLSGIVFSIAAGLIAGTHSRLGVLNAAG